ncbi:hypothetical protein K438DRAFT_1953981 [Mycena galopus ATCC 62051]|nr:hypothetical protein K438DRAFT_1953981 [Mycena galopus ATCC 62051]
MPAPPPPRNRVLALRLVPSSVPDLTVRVNWTHEHASPARATGSELDTTVVTSPLSRVHALRPYRTPPLSTANSSQPAAHHAHQTPNQPPPLARHSTAVDRRPNNAASCASSR